MAVERNLDARALSEQPNLTTGESQRVHVDVHVALDPREAAADPEPLRGAEWGRGEQPAQGEHRDEDLTQRERMDGCHASRIGAGRLELQARAAEFIARRGSRAASHSTPC